MGAVFLSYRRADSEDKTEQICKAIKAQLPMQEVFWDKESIRPGTNFPELLRERVTDASVVLVIIGPQWLEILKQRKGDPVDYVRDEVRIALESPAVVIPVTIGGARVPSKADLADFPDLMPLSDCSGMLVRSDRDFDHDIGHLVKVLADRVTSESVGATLMGKYKLLHRVGEGGMGTVFAAQQTRPIRRHVAIKLIKPGMDTKDVLARFDAEKQALAVMDHPNIARVLDADMTLLGRPFFVMELVQGKPITEFCDSKKLPLRSRLELFKTVCEAVQHAHQKGIIHRDIKPSNVLVEEIGGQPVLKVIDFGLAKAMGPKLTEQSLLSESGKLLGTLEYMSPEQAEGKPFNIDTRSDIYSLGVLLYELLAGNPPFTRKELEEAGEDEMKRLIREEEPLIPSSRLSSSGDLPRIAANRSLEPLRLTKLLRSELDWIVMKSLEKDRKRRYQTANGLAEEVERYLADEVVLARPPSVGYRMKKFVRKHRSTVVTASLASLALLALFVAACGIIWQAGRTEAAQIREQAEKQQKESLEREAILLREATLHNKGLAAYSFVSRRERMEHGNPAQREPLNRFLEEGIEALEEANAQFPTHYEHAFFLALSFSSFANTTFLNGDPSSLLAALKLLDKSDSLLISIYIADPNAKWIARYFKHANKPIDITELCSIIDNTLLENQFIRFLIYGSLRRYSEALVELDRIKPEGRTLTPPLPPGGDVVEPGPADFTKATRIFQVPESTLGIRKIRREDLIFLRTILLRGAEMEQSRTPWSRGKEVDHLKAMQLAAHLADSPGVVEIAVFNAACVFAIAATAPDLDAAERDRRATIAVGYLDRICKAGYFRHKSKGPLRRSEIAKDHDLDSLRERGDFRRVLSESQVIPTEPTPKPMK